jgi:hypothetical protein
MAAVDLSAYEHIVASVGGRVSPQMECSVGAPLGPRLLNVLVMAKAGEVAISVETLCENLYEYEIPLTQAEHDNLSELARNSGAGLRAFRTLALLDPGRTPSR